MSEDITNMCRLCMEALDLNHTMEDETTLKMVEDCLQLTFTFEPPFLSAEICDDCYYKVKDFHEFKENCRSMQDLLCQEIGKYGRMNSVVKKVKDATDHTLFEVMDDDGKETIHESSDDVSSIEKHPIILNSRLASMKRRSDQEDGAVYDSDPVREVERISVLLSSGKNNQIIVNQRSYHECSLCFRSYNDLAQLQRHQLTHKKKATHICEYCSMSFRQKSSLQAHIRSHTKEKPFVCQHCGNAYGYCQLLKKHLRRYHASESATLLNAATLKQ